MTENTDTADISTEEYSDNLENTILVENEPNVYESKNDLHEVLDRFTDLSTSIIESIDTEYSEIEEMEECKILLNCGYKEGEILDTDLHNIENAGEQIVSNINKFINLPNEIDCSKKRKSDIFDFKKSNKKKCTEKNIEVSSEDIINNTNVDDNHDIENCSCHLPEHLNYVVNLIESKDVLIPLIKKLYKGKILDDFLIMLQLISKGILEANNIPLTLATELAKMHSHKSTTAMVYRPETLDFWSVCYRTCHGSGLNLFSGSKHQGHVVGDKCEMSTYDPSKGSFNFAVPDVKTLLRHQKKVDKFLYAGILNGSFKLLDKAKQFILEYDAKRISCGLDKNNIGDVNLWGYESPSIHELNEQLKCENNLIEELEGIEGMLQ